MAKKDILWNIHIANDINLAVLFFRVIELKKFYDNLITTFSLPAIIHEEMDEEIEVMESGRLTTGPRANLFEKPFGKFVSAPNAMAVSSSTAGLSLSIEALRIRLEHEVINTAYTFTASGKNFGTCCVSGSYLTSTSIKE